MTALYFLDTLEAAKRRNNSRGPLLPQRSCPQSPLRLVQSYSRAYP